MLKMIFIYFLILGCGFFPLTHMMTVKEIANSLNFYLSIDKNYSPKDERFEGHIELTNINQTSSIGSGNWALFLTVTRMMEIDTLVNPGPLPRPDGVPLGDSGFQLYHINGRLFKMELRENNTNYKPIAPGETRIIPYNGNLWMVARTDIPMNVYIASMTDDTEVAVIPNTGDVNRRFVAPFLTEQQYKRVSYDTCVPYTLEERDTHYAVTDLGHDNSRVIPNPRNQQLESESVYLDPSSWVIVVTTDGLEFEAQYLFEKTSIPVSDVLQQRYNLQLSINPSVLSEACRPLEEGYKLDITEDAVIVTGGNTSGVFYGIQTLLQLLRPDGSISQGVIDDCPLFPYRGVMVDVSRNFFSKDEIIKIIDTVSTYKVNKLHLHLTDDDGWRIEIPNIPELTTIGGYRCHDLKEERCILPTHGSPPTPDGFGSGYYTVEDYREILQFASERHVEVIPEIDLPGHSHAAVRAMLARFNKYNSTDPDKANKFLLSDFGDTTEYLTVQLFTDAAVNPCMESTYAFVEEVIDTLIELHKGIQDLKTFHFGGDEVPGAWIESPECERLKEEDPSLPENATTREFIHYFARRLANITSPKGLNLAGWEDGLQTADRETLGEPFPRADFDNEEVLSYLWHNTWEQHVGGGAYRFANADYKSVISHATHFYYDFPNEPEPEERGGYWGSRILDTKRSFLYAIDDIYLNIDVDRWGRPITRDEVCESSEFEQEICPELKPDKESNIVGIQCQLWSETITTGEHLESMMFPRILAMAERGWTKPRWYNVTDSSLREQYQEEDWTGFANALGYRELARLEHMGIKYHLRPPGTRIDGSTMSPFGEFPGMHVLMTTDQGMSWSSTYVNMPVPDRDALLITRSQDGTRSSRPTRFTAAIPSTASTASCFILTTTIVTLYYIFSI